MEEQAMSTTQLSQSGATKNARTADLSDCEVLGKDSMRDARGGYRPPMPIPHVPVTFMAVDAQIHFQEHHNLP